jgi:hypothetical protein
VDTPQPTRKKKEETHPATAKQELLLYVTYRNGLLRVSGEEATAVVEISSALEQRALSR